MKKLLYTLLVVSIIFSACEEETATPPLPVFTGITERAITGETVGNIDNSDWTLDYYWSQVEKDLFSNYNDLIHDYNAYNMTILAYPNPTNDVVKLLVHSIENVNITMVIVDSQFNQIMSGNYNIGADSSQIQQDSSVTTVAPSPSITLTYNLNSTSPGNNLRRFYYIATRNDTCFFKGHGDVIEITI